VRACVRASERTRPDRVRKSDELLHRRVSQGAGTQARTSMRARLVGMESTRCATPALALSSAPRSLAHLAAHARTQTRERRAPGQLVFERARLLGQERPPQSLHGDPGRAARDARAPRRKNPRAGARQVLARHATHATRAASHFHPYAPHAPAAPLTGSMHKASL